MSSGSEYHTEPKRASTHTHFKIDGDRLMAGFSRLRSRVLPAIVGIAIGSIVALVTLAATPLPLIHWPATAQVEYMGTDFTPRTMAGGSVEVLASDCTAMLVDVDSSVPTFVWATPWRTPIDFKNMAPPLTSYYWSGLAPVEHVSTVVTVSNPAAGVSLTVFDASFNESGPASFGFVFSANDCPQ